VRGDPHRARGNHRVNAQAGGGFTAIALMMLVVGMGIPMTAALNAALGTHIGSPVAASAILFGIGFVLTAIVLAIVGLPPASAFSGVPLWSFAAALGVVFYVLSVTWSAPRIGVGNAIFFVLLGQLIAAATIDHFALFGALKTTLTAKRALGLLVMALGVYLAKKPR
jgi:bacterial/archaeal transporter family-2 protein